MAQDVEWFYSARELCTLMDGVDHLPLMSINPGVAARRDWARPDLLAHDALGDAPANPRLAVGTKRA